MSIIGTRPPLISETSLYELHHRARLAIKPGITGMWQVSGRSDITDFEEVVRLDKEYIENWNGIGGKIMEQSYEEGKVSVHSLVDEECVVMTAELIQASFEKRNTGIREAACQYRVDRLAESMNILYKTLEKHRKNPESQRYIKSLRSSLSRKSTFAAFKRNYVRKHIIDYPDLEDFLL